MAIDAPAILGQSVTFPNGMKAPNRFLKVCPLHETRRRCTDFSSGFDHSPP